MRKVLRHTVDFRVVAIASLWLLSICAIAQLAWAHGRSHIVNTNRDACATMRMQDSLVILSTSYTSKHPDMLSVEIENKHGFPISIGRIYGLLTREDGRWIYLAKGKMRRRIIVPAMSTRKFNVSLCTSSIRRKIGWVYTSKEPKD